ncbi:MAG: trypsin-like peptidase domain-containing protein [Planctomycetes bacterium]|uniref:trypsin-like peptidase domain-containing protein n=1 Tax=Candidatus Wunengus sp. YC65 TaxID=3367701 RepID=UPI001D38CF90|nr:trypsin-like peptidase domain-containing protein [Planctomycetota bacterium]
MNKILAMAILCIVTLAPLAQADEKEDFYSQINRAVIRLEHFEAIQQKGSTNVITQNIPDGTAVFIASSNVLYVVTVRHVVEKPYDLHARVQCKNEKRGEQEVILLELPRDKWTYHENNGDQNTDYVDVAVMKIFWIQDRSIKNFRYEPKGSKDHDKNQLPMEDANPPQAILVFGFPADLGFQLLEQKPMGRFGIVSMKTGKEFLKLESGKFAEERCYLVDARLFGGNSGSPVMNQMTITDAAPRLLGLIKAANANLDFAVMEPVSRIRETLDLAKDKPMSGNWKVVGQ